MDAAARVVLFLATQRQVVVVLGDEVAFRVSGYQNAEQFLASLARVDALGLAP